MITQSAQRPPLDVNVRMSDQLDSDQSSRRYNRHRMLTLRKSAECTLPGKSLEAVCLSVLAAGALIRVILRGRTSGESFSGNCISHLTRTVSCKPAAKCAIVQLRTLSLILRIPAFTHKVTRGCAREMIQATEL